MRTQSTSNHCFVKRSGITLIELTITMLLIGIIAAVASPKITSNLNYFRVESAAAQIAADIKLARHHAKTAGKDQAVIFNVAGNSYSMPGMPDINHPAIDYSLDLDDLSGEISLDQVDFTDPDSSTVIFNMYGKPDQEGEVVIQSGSLTRTITIESSLGKVQVQ